MPFTLTATVYTGLPGAVRLDVLGDPGVVSSIVRLDAAAEGQPVRNYAGTGSGLDTVVDCEAPLGRPVRYSLLAADGTVLATSGYVTCDPPSSGHGILRSVLRPQVLWMEIDGQDETGVEWATSTTVHRIVGSDTPTVVGEVRQRRSGTMTFLCRSIAEANRLIAMCSDGTLMLVRFSPCASAQVRDLLFYPLDITERRWGRQGWRLVSVDYQASKFVPGDTEEPPLGAWTFGDLRDSAPDFQTLSGRYASFGAMAFDQRKAAV